MSENAKSLIQEINDYMQESMKKSYVFTLDEEIALKYNIEILQKHIDMLIDYENERNK